VASETTAFIFGSSVSCSDGPCGELTRIVVDPAARTVTHLVVRPPGQDAASRLVPVRLLDGAGPAIRLRCALSRFSRLEEAEQTQIVPGALGEQGSPEGHRAAAPYYGRGGMGLAMAIGTGLGSGTAPRRISADRIPAGKAEVRAADHVQAADGSIGRIQGLTALTRGHQVTSLLVAEGHLRGRRTVAIPISAVAGFGDGVRLSLTRDEVRDLPTAAG